MVNTSSAMSSERAIPDLWDVFGSRGGGLAVRRNSWQKMQKQLSEDERTVTELFNDLHVHADLPAENNSIPSKHKNGSNQRNKTDEYNERNNISNNQQSNNNWEHIEKHLSMKKTIRKKMMRDLQQAFIDGQEPPDAVQKWDNVQLDAHKAGIEPNLLDMLKEKKTEQQPVQTQPNAPVKKPGFWKKLTMRKSSSSKR
ncbi:hypothetical protein GHT06_021482 [Daphnia sinensis]|uniref:Uncharacterized protein n=1 Tax=Daphnia sinensis TaxID=1820382 RepID=A0AAD5KJ75_9CRUS|nr:hypothetical protein GHT06_021482 [Daphnia sinensis]